MADDAVGKEIKFFFGEPWDGPPRGEDSPLRLLRRSIVACFLLNPGERASYDHQLSPVELHERAIVLCGILNPGVQSPYLLPTPPVRAETFFQAWTAVMLICAGMDLLGKLYAGDDRGKVGKRFTGFVQAFFPGQDPCLVYSVRNTLMHSFALVSPDEKTRFSFHPASGQKNAVEKFPEQGMAGKDVIRTDYWKLWLAFDDAIRAYRRALDGENGSHLRKNFKEMRKYVRCRFD